jgi:hypothetical protein
MATMVGTIGCTFAIAYYAAPLSMMANVVMTRDSSALYLPTTIVNILNAGMWSIYGFGLMDINVWAPNVIGLLLSIAQLVLIIVFPRKVASGNVILVDDENGLQLTDIYGKESPQKSSIVSPLH